MANDYPLFGTWSDSLGFYAENRGRSEKALADVRHSLLGNANQICEKSSILFQSALSAAAHPRTIKVRIYEIPKE